MSDWDDFEPVASAQLRRRAWIAPRIRGVNYPTVEEEFNCPPDKKAAYTAAWEKDQDALNVKRLEYVRQQAILLKKEHQLKEALQASMGKKKNRGKEVKEFGDQAMEVVVGVANVSLGSSESGASSSNGAARVQTQGASSSNALAQAAALIREPAGSSNAGSQSVAETGEVSHEDIVDPSLRGNDGIIIQFVNTNCLDSASIIGAVRTPVRELSGFPAYLSQHRPMIKVHAVAALQRHLISCQSPTGAGETDLTIDDFSLSFMVASVSDDCARLNPSGRREAGMWICAYPWLAKQVDLDLIDPLDSESPNRTYVVNCYVHLLDQNRRRRFALQKAKEEGEKEKRKIAVPAAKQQKQGNQPALQQSSKPNQANVGGKTRRELQQELDAARQVIQGLAGSRSGPVVAVDGQPLFPALPAPAVALSWNRNGMPRI